MIQIKGFYVVFKGDKSVGIFDAEWQIAGGFEFEDEECLSAFKDRIVEAWEYCSDAPVYIETFEEREEWLRKENEMGEEQIKSKQNDKV